LRPVFSAVVGIRILLCVFSFTLPSIAERLGTLFYSTRLLPSLLSSPVILSQSLHSSRPLLLSPPPPPIYRHSRLTTNLMTGFVPFPLVSATSPPVRPSVNQVNLLRASLASFLSLFSSSHHGILTAIEQSKAMSVSIFLFYTHPCCLSPAVSLFCVFVLASP